MATLRHIAVATQDPDATAQFYIDVFDFKPVRKAGGAWGYGHILTDGTLNLAILRFTSDAAAGLERGSSFSGLHHLGFEVDDIDDSAERVEKAGGRPRIDINEGLGVPSDGTAHGEFKFEGPDGVVFDLGKPGFWSLTPATDK
jgi:catechol 2,3-dioxygenase-like lactoylglutathione lyase family enzyme